MAALCPNAPKLYYVMAQNRYRFVLPLSQGATQEAIAKSLAFWEWKDVIAQQGAPLADWDPTYIPDSPENYWFVEATWDGSLPYMGNTFECKYAWSGGYNPNQNKPGPDGTPGSGDQPAANPTTPPPATKTSPWPWIIGGFAVLGAFAIAFRSASAKPTSIANPTGRPRTLDFRVGDHRVEFVSHPTQARAYRVLIDGQQVAWMHSESEPTEYAARYYVRKYAAHVGGRPWTSAS